MTRKRGGVANQLIGAIVLAAVTVAVWWLWLGWDTEYQVDPVTGVSSGPYEPWQVIGCVLSLLVIAVAGGLLLRPWLVPLVMTPAFTVTWSLWAADDETGLWAVGATMVLIGVLAGSALCAFGASAIRAAVTRRR